MLPPIGFRTGQNTENLHQFLFGIDGVNDSIVADSHPPDGVGVSLKLDSAPRQGIFGEFVQLSIDALSNLLRQVFEIAVGGRLDANAIAHSSPAAFISARTSS